MERLVLVVVLVAVAAVVAWVVRRRTAPDPPTQSSWSVPSQLDRDDFERPDAPWIVVVFGSATCLSCQGTWAKVEQLESDHVAVQDVEAVERKDLHTKYRIDAVPMLVVANADGVVVASFIGEPSTADLWAAVAEVREPGSTPEGCDHGQTPH
jgi:hypothetical protein